MDYQSKVASYFINDNQFALGDSAFAVHDLAVQKISQNLLQIVLQFGIIILFGGVLMTAASQFI